MKLRSVGFGGKHGIPTAGKGFCIHAAAFYGRHCFSLIGISTYEHLVLAVDIAGKASPKRIGILLSGCKVVEFFVQYHVPWADDHTVGQRKTAVTTHGQRRNLGLAELVKLPSIVKIAKQITTPDTVEKSRLIHGRSAGAQTYLYCFDDHGQVKIRRCRRFGFAGIS